MDHSRLTGILCLLLPLLCGCNDPGFDLRRAAYDGNAAAVEKILKAHPELVNDREKPDPVPVVAPGASRASTDWVDFLFDGGEEGFFSDNRSRMTPLHLAVRTQKEDVVKLLLSHKANANATNIYGHTPLFDAARLNTKPALTSLLLDAKADPNLKDRQGCTALHWAVMNRNSGSAELLLKRGAQINATNVIGMTPFHFAAQEGYGPMVRLLLVHKTAMDDRDARGNTPLYLAADRGQTNTVKLLLEYGADVNAGNNDGSTPLFHLVQNSRYRWAGQHYLNMIDQLLTSKAQVNVTNIFGKTLFQEALRAGDTNVINRLRQHGAKE